MGSVAAIIVTYNNCEMLFDVLSDLAGQTKKPESVIVIDNASKDQTKTRIPSSFPWVDYVRLPSNAGSAGGFRAGFERANSHFDFLFTLDDDVRLQPDSLEKLEQGFEILCKTENLAGVRCVGPQHPESVPSELVIAPWRGTMFHMPSVQQAGLPRDDYFIYGEDLEYSLRMKKAGKRFFWVPFSVCTENNRSKTNRRLLGKKIDIYNSPFRLYYAFRNEISIYREYRLLKNLGQVLLYAAKVIVYIACTEGTKGSANLNAVFTGIIHGFQNRLGPCERFFPSG